MQRHVGSYAQAPGCVCWQVEYGGIDESEGGRPGSSCIMVDFSSLRV